MTTNTEERRVAKKLGVIVPCSREFLHYKMSDFFEQMKPKMTFAQSEIQDGDVICFQVDLNEKE